MQGFSTYPRMRPSGVEWLSDVPEHWEVRRIKYLLTLNESTLSEDTSPDFTFDYVDIGSVGTGRLLDAPKRIKFQDSPSRARRVIREGDTLFSTVRTYLKAVWQAKAIHSNLVASTGFVVLTPGQTTFPKFVSWFCQCGLFTDWVSSISVGVAYPAIPETDFASVHFVVPPFTEQKAIAHVLDHTTNQIDRLIQANERLIELLGELKQATIHEAVTGRIDVRTGRPYAKYKDSGVEWLGDVPKHWVCSRLRNIAKIHFSNVDKHVRDGEKPVRLCNYADVYHNDRIHSDMDFMKATASTDEVNRHRLVVGDVLITKDSEVWNDIGVPALVESSDSDLVCGYHLAQLRPIKGKLQGRFLHGALSCSRVAIQFHIRANGVTRFGLSQDSIKSVWLPVPPHAEQTAIGHFLDHTTNHIEKSIDARTKNIDLLKEFRTRLIADVVTGKVDVRASAAELPDSELLM